MFTSIQIAIHITGALLLGAIMPKQWLVVSIALLTAGSVMVQGLVAYQLLKRRIGGLAGFGIGKSLGLNILAMLPASAVGASLLWVLGGITQGAFPVDKVLTAVMSAAIVGSAMVVSYLAMLWLLRVPELREVFSQLRGRFGGK